MGQRATLLTLRAIRAWDRLRLWRLRSLHPGLRIHPTASTNLAAARYELAPAARLEIGAGVVTERMGARLHFSLGPGAHVRIGDGTWLRTELGEVHVVAFEGARLELGPEGFLNGCHLSAKQSLRIGRRTWIGPGSRIFDSDQHDFDADRPETSSPVVLGDHIWVASDVTILKGVTIGDHSVIGTRALVTADVPAHSLALGSPARVRGSVGDRSQTR